MADCRKCRYFVPFEELGDGMKEEAASKAFRMGRDPNRVLGFCMRKRIPITYYEGYCKDFTKRRPTQLTLSTWVKTCG